MSETEAAALPREPAEALRLRPAPPRVVRLSRKALIVMGATGSIAISGALFWALRTAGPAQPPPELINIDSRQTSERLDVLPRDYSGVPKLGPPLPGDLGRPMLAAGVPPAPAAPAAPTEPTRVDRQAEVRLQRAQERAAAHASRLFAAEARAGAPTPNPSGPAVEAAPVPPAPASDARRAFLERTDTRPPTASHRLSPPASPYLLQAGSTIAAALITGLRSDLPGQVTAQVTAPVHGGPTGRTILIPQGARLIGEYEAGLRFGDRRALLVWTRLILPDGRSVVLDREPGADAAGHAGLEDRVDNHWGQIFKAAFVSTLLSVGSEAGSSAEEGALVRALRRGSSDAINQAGQQIVGRSLAIQPTLTIRPGFPVRVIVTRDLPLEPWREDR